MPVTYRYTEGDLLESPQTYRYAAYEGEAFVNAWKASRQQASGALPAPEALPLAQTAQADVRDCEALLAQLCRGLRQAPPHQVPQASYWLPRLVKKFEVSKRLHAGYALEVPHPALPGSSYLALAPYLLLAEAMVHGWRAEKAAWYLSALLKLNDTLISQIPRLAAPQRMHLAWLLENEGQLIEQVRP
ncbi:hypothetical protein [Pseudomonas sp. KNUC1026]|uniref:hypothetical protein n=1 Tax=Pseudomonas sp. KNUC1026 TaxID=2893890 RepID=UPI001F190F20|nr:hypothetical protein [Pseudomonas sp. KNUC1026]UFH48259.1 hypothetical protein LN139_13895 [Pseudomonas sp. KNUC1026]